MKTKLLSVVFILALVACGKPDKQKELVKLQKQHDELSEKILKLEQEIAKESGNAASAEGLRVAVAELKTSEFVHYIEVQGKIDGDENVAVFPEAMGVVEQIFVKPGQKVNKGQVLASLNDGAMREQIKAMESNYKLANEVFEKQKNLWDQKIGSEVQYLQAKTNKESVEGQLAALKHQADMMQIKSPINGTIEDAPIKLGQTASPQLPVFRVVSFGGLKVTADIAEGYSSKINVGDKVVVFLPDLKKEIVAQVNFTSKYINPINRTFQVEAQITTETTSLKANMIAVIKINDYRNNTALTVPINVVQNDQNGNFVFIASKKGNEPVAEKVPVAIGETYKGLTEIKSGLKAGDLIIVAGYQDIENGQAVAF